MSAAGKRFADVRARAAAGVLCAAALLAGCDAGVERTAAEAVERAAADARRAAGGPAHDIIEGYLADMGRTSAAYDAALKASGYHLALAEAALTSAEEFEKAPGRIAAARTAALTHRALALSQADQAIARLRALAAADPGEAAPAQKLLAELTAARQRRAQQWDYAVGIIDETHAAWETLAKAQGDWGLEADGLKFTALEDKDAYDAHAARIGAYASRQDRLGAAQQAQVAALRRIAREYGG